MHFRLGKDFVTPIYARLVFLRINFIPLCIIPKGIIPYGIIIQINRIMQKSPFIYGNTVSETSFTNRESEVEKLKSNLLNGINTMIISPRRWGKSSLVEKVLLEINQDDRKTKTVNMDLFSYNSQEAFLEGFAKEIIRASTPKWQEWLNSGKEFFKRIIPKINVGMDPVTDFSISFDWSELKKYSDEILNLPEVIAIEKDIKMIICLDEFQNLAGFSDFENFEKKTKNKSLK